MDHSPEQIVKSDISSIDDNKFSLHKLFSECSDNDYDKYDKNEFSKDCPEYTYLPSILPDKNRIIVIGDLHGDYKLTIDCLKLANVIDDNINWIGNDTIIVQIGDQIDRCRPYNYKCDNPVTTINDEASDIKILELFNRLHIEATTNGGAVYSLLGNHELMNVTGNLNYVSYLGLTEFEDYKDPLDNSITFKSGKSARKHAFAPGNQYGKMLGCTRLSSIIIGSFLFVHAGIIPEFTTKINIKKRKDLYKLNFAVRKWLLGLINKDYISQIVGSFKYSIFWDRILGNIPPNMNNNNPRCVKYLDPVLDIFKVGKMFIGHTPQYFSNKEGINNTCDNKLWRVDIGGSTAFNSFDDVYTKSKLITKFRKAQILEITDNSKIKIIR